MKSHKLQAAPLASVVLGTQLRGFRAINQYVKSVRGLGFDYDNFFKMVERGFPASVDTTRACGKNGTSPLIAWTGQIDAWLAAQVVPIKHAS